PRACELRGRVHAQDSGLAPRVCRQQHEAVQVGIPDQRELRNGERGAWVLPGGIVVLVEREAGITRSDQPGDLRIDLGFVGGGGRPAVLAQVVRPRLEIVRVEKGTDRYAGE